MTMIGVRIVVIVVMLVAGGFAPASAVEDLDVRATAGVFTDYVWRGQLSYEGLALQPQIDLGYRAFSGQVWANVGLDEDAGETTEVDLVLAWSALVGKLSWTATAIEYVFPTGAPGTREVGFSVAYGGLWAEPRLAVFRDIGVTDGTYATLTVSKSFAWGNRTEIAAEILLAWGDRKNNASYFGLDQGGANDGVMSFTLRRAIADGVTFSALVRAWDVVDGDVARAARGAFGDDQGVAGALMLTFEL